MLSLYYPIRHIQEDWSKSHGVSGKIAVILFYSLIWLGILSLCVLFFDPASQGVDCALENFDAYTQACFKSMARMMCPFLVAFFVYMEKQGVHSLCNVTTQAVAITLSIWGMSATAQADDDQNRITPECSQSLRIQFIAYLVWAWLVVLCVLMDWYQARRCSSSSVNNQPLVSSDE